MAAGAAGLSSSGSCTSTGSVCTSVAISHNDTVRAPQRLHRPRTRSCNAPRPRDYRRAAVVEATMARRTHRRRACRGIATCALALGALALPASAPAQTACPGATPACPYTASSQIGQRAGGVLRFPQSVAIGPDGSVYVADQSSSVVQVFGPDGALRREVGRAGTRPGELTSVGAIAVAGDNSLFVADGNNRIDRFDATGRFVSSFGKRGTGVGEFNFGKGGGNDAPAGGGLVASGQLPVRLRQPQQPRPALQPRRLGRRRDRPARAALQPARPRGSRAAAHRRRRQAPPARRHGLRRARPEDRRQRPGRRRQPVQLPVRRRDRPAGPRLRRRRHQPARAALRPAARLQVQGPLGQLRHRPRPARLPARDRLGLDRPDLRDEHRQRPHRRLRPRRPAAALVGRVGPRPGPVQRAGRRRRRRPAASAPSPTRRTGAWSC